MKKWDWFGEVERLNNTFISEKHLKQKEKEDKKQTQAALFNYFYKQFKKHDINFDYTYKKLSSIRKREEILNDKNIKYKNSLNFEELNNIYNKTLKRTYFIFKENYKYIEEVEKDKQFFEEETPEDDEPPKKQLDWEYFWQVIGIILLFPLFVILGAVAYDGKRKRR